MDLVSLQIDCKQPFRRMLTSQQSDKTGLDVKLEYFASKLETALITLNTSKVHRRICYTLMKPLHSN